MTGRVHNGDWEGGAGIPKRKRVVFQKSGAERPGELHRPRRGQVRTETQTLGLAAKTSTATPVRAGLVNRSGQNKTAKG